MLPILFTSLFTIFARKHNSVYVTGLGNCTRNAFRDQLMRTAMYESI